MSVPAILVADDDPHIRDVIGFALRRAGMEPEMARDGAEALRLFRTRHFDLAVLDVGMPEMDGLDLCGEIRKTSQLPILFLSARDEEVDRVLGLEIGGDDLTKPFSPRELVARVKAILKRTRPVAAPSRTLAHGRLTRKERWPYQGPINHPDLMVPWSVAGLDPMPKTQEGQSQWQWQLSGGSDSAHHSPMNVSCPL